jgi:hypothetical protein
MDGRRSTIFSLLQQIRRFQERKHVTKKISLIFKNVIILKDVQRPLWFKLPHKDKQKIIVYEHDTVTQVVQCIAHRVELDNKDIFGLKLLREEGEKIIKFWG